MSRAYTKVSSETLVRVVQYLNDYTRAINNAHPNQKGVAIDMLRDRQRVVRATILELQRDLTKHTEYE